MAGLSNLEFRAEDFLEQCAAFVQCPFLEHQVTAAAQGQQPSFFLWHELGIRYMLCVAHIHAVCEAN